MAKVRSAGVDCFRYLLDYPLQMIAEVGKETGVVATKIAALVRGTRLHGLQLWLCLKINLASQVWGRDDDGGGLVFKQEDVNRIVQVADHRGPIDFQPMRHDHGQSILQLCVSDQNKGLLLSAEGFIPLLVDSLLLDPEHPRKNQVTVTGGDNFEAAKGPVQLSTVSCQRYLLQL